MAFLCMAFFTFSLAAVDRKSVASDTPSGLLDKAQAQIDSGKYKKAAELLEKALADARLAGPERGKAVVLLARSQRMSGSPAEAVRTLGRILDSRDPGHNIELAECRLALGDPSEARRAASSYGQKDPAELQARSSWALARACFDLLEYKSCMNACAAVPGAVSAYRRESRADKREAEELERIRKKAEELFERARELFEEEAYGEDYARYRKARAAEAAGSLDEAVRLYAKVRSGIFRQASELYSACCLSSKGESKEATKRLL